MWKDKISRTILNILPPYNGIDVLKLPFLEELYEKTFVVLYVYSVYRVAQNKCPAQYFLIFSPKISSYRANFFSQKTQSIKMIFFYFYK